MHLLLLSQPPNRTLLPPAALAAARAFTHDSLFLWLRPHGAPPNLTPDPPLIDPPPPFPFEQTPWFRHLRMYFLFRLRSALATPGTRVVVAMSDPGDAWWSGEREVLGWAVWVRESGEVERGERERREERWGGDTWGKRVERGLVGWERWYWDVVGGDVAVEGARRRILDGAWEGFARVTDRWLKEGKEGGEGLGRGEGYVWLQFLAVDPRFQRKGVGGLLMEWGMERAREEDVPVGLTSSPQGMGLYKKWGFEETGETVKYDGMEDAFMVAWVKGDKHEAVG